VELNAPLTVREVIITDQLRTRPAQIPDYFSEKVALQQLAAGMNDPPAEVLAKLVKLAMETCSATSAGVSVLEPEANSFRWYSLCGVLSRFESERTPRDHSPCGVCLDLSQPVLMAHPESVYDWIKRTNVEIPEVLLVPLVAKDGSMLGTLWTVADKDHPFDSEHVRVLTELSSFAGLVLKIIQTENTLKAALKEQEILSREMGHRVKNLFALVDGMVRMTGRTANTPAEMVETLSGRLRALSIAHGLMRHSFVDSVRETTDLRELIETLLNPHSGEHLTAGGSISLGPHSGNDLALVFHELATNAAKYGALREGGTVKVRWKADASRLRIQWSEHGGPKVHEPAQRGFGTHLAESTLKGRLGGTIAYNWKPGGLRLAMEVPLLNLKV